MYWVSTYFLKENKGGEYQRWLQSEEAKNLFAGIQKETGMRYMQTYWPILGFGEYDCEDWYEVPNWASLDKIRDSESLTQFFSRMYELDFYDNTRQGSNRMLRATTDVMIFEP